MTKRPSLRGRRVRRHSSRPDSPLRMTRLAGVFAHPDDDVYTIGGTLLLHPGVLDPALIFATSGEAGPISDPSLATRETLGEVRKREQHDALGAIGYPSVRVEWLGHPDYYLPDVPFEHLVDEIKTLFDELRPHIVVTFGPDGLTSHHDHIRVGEAATGAFHRARKAGGSSEDGAFERLLYVALIALLEPKALTHSGEIPVRHGRSEVARRINESTSRARQREAQGVIDNASANIGEANEPGKYRRPRSVRRGPMERAQSIEPKVPDRPRSGQPGGTAGLSVCIEHLVGLAVCPVDDYHVPVTIRTRATLDWSVGWDGVRAGIRLPVIDEPDRNLLLAASYRCEGNSDGSPVPATGPEVGVEGTVEAGAPKHGRRPGVNRQPVDALVPGLSRGNTRQRGAAGRGWPDTSAAEAAAVIKSHASGDARKSHPPSIVTLEPFREPPSPNPSRSMGSPRPAGACRPRDKSRRPLTE